MQFDFPITVMLTKATDLPGCLVAWCPEVDVVSQGYSVEQAFGMCLEAVRYTCEGELETYARAARGRDLDCLRKPVRHPLRRGIDPSLRDEPEWLVWNSFLEGEISCVNVSVEEFLTGPEPIGWVRSRVEVVTLGGIVFVNAVDRYGFYGRGSISVPAQRFRIEYDETFPRSIEFCIRSSEIERAGDVGPILRAKLSEELAHVDRSGHNKFGHHGQRVRVTGVRAKHPIMKVRE